MSRSLLAHIWRHPWVPLLNLYPSYLYLYFYRILYIVNIAFHKQVCSLEVILDSVYLKRGGSCSKKGLNAAVTVADNLYAAELSTSLGSSVLCTLICLFVDLEVLLTVTYASVTLECTMYGADFETICKLQLVQNAAVWVLTVASQYAYSDSSTPWTALASSRLMSTVQDAGCHLKTLHGVELSYLQDCLSPIESICSWDLIG